MEKEGGGGRGMSENIKILVLTTENVPYAYFRPCLPLSGKSRLFRICPYSASYKKKKTFQTK